jgi:hypothetical protein
MRKIFYYAIFSFVCFSLGFVIRHNIIFPPYCDRYTKHAISLQENIYRDNDIHTPTRFSLLSDRYKNYSPSSDNSEIRVIFSNPFAGLSGIVLSGQGDIYKVNECGKGRSNIEPYERQLVHKISQEKSNVIFSNIINSGILNFDKAVIDLKKDLILDGTPTIVCDASYTFIEISAPSLEVEKIISVYALFSEISDHPHIKEYQILSNIRDQLLALLPELNKKTEQDAALDR